MAKPWSEVISNPEFQKLTPEEQLQAQEQYFNEVVTPKATADGAPLDEVRAQFFSQGAPIEQETQDVVLPEPPQDLTQQSVVEQPIAGESWAPIEMGPSQEASNWAATLEPGLGMKPGYRGDGSVNREDPRWRGMDDYQVASQMASDERGDVWASIPTNMGDNPLYGRSARQAGRDIVNAATPNIRANSQEKTPEEWAAFYGTQDQGPSVWDKANIQPEDLPQASEAGSTVLDAVYADKAQLMAQGMSDAEAEAKAFENAGRNALQFTAGVAAAPLGVGALATMPARMVGAGAVNTLAGGTADILSGKEPQGEQMAEDFLWGTLGGVGAGAGKGAVTAKLGSAADDLKVLKSASVQELDDLAKQAQAKQSVSASKQSGEPMRDVLEGTESVTASDVLDASTVAKTLNKLNASGGKVDISNVLSSVRNPELRQLLESAAPVRSLAAKADEAVESVVGSDITELLGLGSTSSKRATREAISEVTEGMTEGLQWSKESLDIVGNYKGATKASFDKAFNSLESAQEKILTGNFAGAKKELAKTANRKANFRKAFGSTTADEIQRIRTELQTLIDVAQTTKGYSAPNNLFGKMKSMGIPTLASYAANPVLGAGVSLGKAAGRMGVNKLNAKKLADVEKALGGKLKMDATAERMLAEGQEMGAVIGYLVAQMLSED